jgi:hypothetical protein
VTARAGSTKDNRSAKNTGSFRRRVIGSFFFLAVLTDRLVAEAVSSEPEERQVLPGAPFWHCRWTEGGPLLYRWRAVLAEKTESFRRSSAPRMFLRDELRFA